MTDDNAIASLVSQYEKHGWQLRIVLRSEGTKGLDLPLPKEVVVLDSPLNALWFSRANGNKESWELRRVGGSPFALVRFIEAHDTESVRDEVLRSAESEMLSAKSDPRGN